MSFIEIMNTYFRGEKLEAYWFILPAGVALVLLGAVAFKVEKGGFALGVAIPCLLFGLILIGTGLGVGTRTAGQIAEIHNAFLEDPVTIGRKELARMEKVNANFRMTYFAFGVLVLAGLLVHYFGGGNWGRGLGAMLILAGGIGLLIDGFAERRAEPYTAALQALSDNQSKSQIQVD
ncbi:MAG: hypothetical protein ACR2RB_23285 [Gammaproteobacteria bacterium]